MKRVWWLLVLVVFLAGLSILVGFWFRIPFFLSKTGGRMLPVSENKAPILRVALVADSENENGLLAKALAQAQGMGINFVIGLGDWSNVGTVDQLIAAKEVFDKSKIPYFLTAGDHDLWDSRNKGLVATANFKQVFGEPTQVFERENVLFVILDNSDIYSGISQEDWVILNSKLETRNSKLVFVFAHKTPFHPQSKHVMGEDSKGVSRQAERFLNILEGQSDIGTEDIKNIKENTLKVGFDSFEVDKPVDGFVSGDLHFFAQFKSPSGSVKITTVGAVSGERNFQGPRFAILTVWDDWRWEVEDVEIR